MQTGPDRVQINLAGPDSARCRYLEEDTRAHARYLLVRHPFAKRHPIPLRLLQGTSATALAQPQSFPNDRSNFNPLFTLLFIPTVEILFRIWLLVGFFISRCLKSCGAAEMCGAARRFGHRRRRDPLNPRAVLLRRVAAVCGVCFAWLRERRHLFYAPNTAEDPRSSQRCLATPRATPVHEVHRIMHLHATGPFLCCLITISCPTREPRRGSRGGDNLATAPPQWGSERATTNSTAMPTTHCRALFYPTPVCHATALKTKHITNIFFLFSNSYL